MKKAQSSFRLIFLSFSLTSAAFLAWVYHLMKIIENPARVDLYTMVGGYLCQAAGIGLFMYFDRCSHRSSKKNSWFYKSGRTVFTAVTFVFFLCSIPAVLSRFAIATLIFGYVMNIAIGVIAGFYLYDLSARVNPSMRGIVFGGSYGLSAIAVWLLSMLGSRNILQSPYCLLLLMVMAGALVYTFPAEGQAPRTAAFTGHTAAGSGIKSTKPDRSLLLLAVITVCLFSMEKNLGFSFPTSDLIAGVNLEFSRTIYAMGLITAGLISDRSRKYGAVCAFAALITPFILLSLYAQTISSTIFWSLDYFFYGFFSVYRVLLLSDLASGKSFPEQSTDTGIYGFSGNPDSLSKMLWLAPLGLLAGRIGDALGTLYSIGIGGRMPMLVIITSVFFAFSVFAFFKLYPRLYVPVIIREQKKRQRTAEEQFEDFSRQYQLTVRERSVLRLALQEKTNSEIAQDLFISESTVKFHIHNLLQKTGCANRIDLYARYRNAQTG